MAGGGYGAAGARPREAGDHGRGGGQVACGVRSWLRLAQRRSMSR
uniref:Uncharacterized protein n=1 Tax=Arundo donax TaxID=35708 RepID=A0A0A9C9M9_ARUDO